MLALPQPAPSTSGIVELSVENMITLKVNGQSRELNGEAGLLHFLRESAIDTRLVAVAINGEVIPKREYENVRLQDGDSVEIVRMVGGG
jgi:sulfur carrier protein